MGLEPELMKNQVLDCPKKDEQGLNDFQKLPSQSPIAINRVGIERFRLPLSFHASPDEAFRSEAHASMFINLEAHKTGVNMSRFCAILQAEAQRHSAGPELVKATLLRFQTELKDFPEEDNIRESYLKLNFSLPMKQPSLKSDYWGWQYYPVAIKGLLTADGEFKYAMELSYEYSSTCPCSLSMAKQYEADFQAGRTREGDGIAVAHSQRSSAQVKLLLDSGANFSWDEFIQLMRKAIPTETQSLVKRQDEQAFAILNGSHPLFVEHASRRLWEALEREERVVDWQVKVEHFESLHSHNAVAEISKPNPKTKLFDL
jgi:GTP cyclohydrolase IB